MRATNYQGGPCRSALLFAMVGLLAATIFRSSIDAALGQPSAGEWGDCTLVDGIRTCVLKQAWGTQTVYFNSAIEEPGESTVPGLSRAELRFDDVRSRPLEMSIAIGQFMLKVLPGSTPASCDALISKMYIAFASRSDVSEYGWRWKIAPGADPARTAVFTAVRAGQ
jgi:hypothetical protein